MESESRIAKALEVNLPPDKWKFFYDYARKSLDEDIARFQIIDEKAGKFLTLISVVLGVFSGIVPWVFEHNFPPSSLLSWALVVVLFLTFIALVSAWGFLFRTIKIARVPRMSLNDEIDDLFWDEEFPNIYYKLTKACRNALEINREVIDEKGKLIKLAYKDITVSAWLVALGLVLIISLKLSEGMTMTNENDKPQETTQSQEAVLQPDRDATPPDIELVLNSEDPDKYKNVKILNENGE